MLNTALLLFALVATPVEDKVDFETQILPALKNRCIECHGTAKEKPKAGLRLDGVEWIRAGSRNGAVLVPGSPGRSEWFTRVALPADDFDVMPPDGVTLTKEEIDTLEKWIREGADFGDWVGAGGPTEAVETRKDAAEPLRIRTWRELGAKRKPFDVASLPKATRDKARMVPVFEDSPLLRVTFLSHEDEIDDAVVKSLKPAVKNLGYLDLARTKVTSRGLASLESAQALTHLNLRSTTVDDAALTSIAKLVELRSLNLYDTQVGDDSIAKLAALPHLTDLYLWKSNVTRTGVAELRKLRPDMRVRYEPGIPSGGR